jgi:hypothetical protein
MHKLSLKAFDEIEATQLEASKLNLALELARNEPNMLAGSWGWITFQGFAAVIEKIYVGCERALDSIARNVDGSPIARGTAWHRDFLERMAKPYSTLRPVLLTSDTANILDVLRSFRHRARNTYGSVLDVERVLEIAHQATDIPKKLHADVVSLSLSLSDR